MRTVSATTRSASCFPPTREADGNSVVPSRQSYAPRSPRILQNAEFWPGEFSDIPSTALPVLAPASAGGAGFDVVQHDTLRDALRSAVGMRVRGSPCGRLGIGHRGAHSTRLGSTTHGAPSPASKTTILSWQGGARVFPRSPIRSDRRSWYARSRSRFATAMLLTAPGIPQLFMGQEFLEDKPWDTSPDGPNLLWWDGLNSR